MEKLDLRLRRDVTTYVESITAPRRRYEETFEPKAAPRKRKLFPRLNATIAVTLALTLGTAAYALLDMRSALESALRSALNQTGAGARNTPAELRRISSKQFAALRFTVYEPKWLPTNARLIGLQAENTAAPHAIFLTYALGAGENAPEFVIRESTAPPGRPLSDVRIFPLGFLAPSTHSGSLQVEIIPPPQVKTRNGTFIAIFRENAVAESTTTRVLKSI